MTLRLRVAAARMLGPDVRELVLAPTDAEALPSFAAGSHLAVEYAAGRWNSYSLTGPGVHPARYTISVRLDPSGHGGSRRLHEIALGEHIAAALPRSGFAPVLSARHHVLVAGGIGITPILSHVREAVRWGRSFEVYYVSRAAVPAHLDELLELCGDRLSIFPGRAELWLFLEPALRAQRLGTHLYTCGPAELIDDVAARAAAAGWPAQRVHAERFAAAELDPGAPFAAKLGRSGLLVPVAPGVTLLEALLAKGVNVANLCRQGVCGECRLTVRRGRPAHRDHYLSDDERAAGDAVMACVSRAEGDLLELEL